jgi:hypothetical protein
MKRVTRESMEISLTLRQLRRLVFWARYGLENAIAGTCYDETVELVNILNKLHHLQVGEIRSLKKPTWGQPAERSKP